MFCLHIRGRLLHKGIESFPRNHILVLADRKFRGWLLGDRMKHLLLMLSLTFTMCAGAQQSGLSPAQVTVIRAGTLIDGKSDKARADQVIVIRGNRVESVADAANAKIPAGATVIDLSKDTVLPGLIDSHTHI